MTAQQILAADVLDILFEERNKAYGAYNLRRTYNQRLLTSLLFTFSVVFLLMILLPEKENQNIPQPALPDEVLVVRTIENPPPPEPVPPPPPRAAAPQAAQIQHTTIVVKPDAKVQSHIPTQDVIAVHAVSNVTTNGTAYDGMVPPVENGWGNGMAAPAPEVEKAFAPSYSAPQFPGGAAAWMRFLSRHLRAPDGLQTGEKKSVLIRFLVSADGSITQYEVLQSSGAAFDGEVIRMLKKMPKWKPALQNGKPVTVSFTQPVTFVQQEE